MGASSTPTGATPAEGEAAAVLPLRILLVDDEESIRVTLADDLAAAGHTVQAAAAGDEALRVLESADFDVVISDVRMPGASGLQVLEAARARRPATEVVLMTAYGTVETAVEAMRQGAFHYVLKPFLNDEIVLLVARLARMRALESENRTLTEDLGRLEGFENVVGSSPAMTEVMKVVRTVARSDASILILGESGTGKEVMARAIHRNSPRRERPFVALSCAALPESLLEAELFGHERGAFTDARKERRGRFELADGGTLFLDDVDDVGMSVQVKLLRAIQEREIERVGGERPVAVDIRLVAATKRDLTALMAEGKFREDLYYRLNVVPIKLPPLRERAEDVPLLIHHFLRRFARGRRFEVTADVMASLVQYPWPGNVRELENAVERAIAMAGDETRLKREHLLLTLYQARQGQQPAGQLTLLKDVVAEAEKEHIRRVLKATGNHKAQAAQILGISRKNLWEKMRDYAIE